MIEQFQKDLLDGTKDPGEIIHILKTIKSSFSNWFVLGLGGNILNLSMLRTLRDDNKDKVITAALRRVLQKGSVVNRDRQDTDCLIEFSKSVPVLREIAISDPVVVHTVCPEKFKMEPSNKMGDIGPIRFLGPVNVGKIAVISEDKKDKNKSVLFVLELHSPVKIKDSLELPLVVGFAASEAMLVLLTETGLMVIETVKGTIIPKIPTKKTDLVALCKDLDLNFEGTVKLLKSRLIKKLKPTPKLDPRSIEASPALAKHLHRHSKISEFKVEEGIIKALILADNDAKKLISIELKASGGEVIAEVNVAVAFPVGASDVTLILTSSEGVTLLVSTSQLIVLNNTFHTMAMVDLDTPIADMNENVDELLYLPSLV